MNKISIILILFPVLFSTQNFTEADTLKGADTQFRNFWDVKKYEITVEADAQDKSVSGANKIWFEVKENILSPVFQIDIQQPMKAFVIQANFTVTKTEREGDFLWIHAGQELKKSKRYFVELNYAGNPTVAKNAPWDGGWVFSQDHQGHPMMSVAQEGIGTSVWLPIKDIWNDEPDEGIQMKIITPDHLVGVGNGRLTKVEHLQDKKHYTWEVTNPINAYSIVPNVGNYVNFSDTYEGERGRLDLEYWVLPENLEKAKKQFAQVKPMLSALEYWFGPYPFYEDSYKIVETPYLGMEHQSNIAYGNGFMNGYLGRDLSGTGIGLKWDFIIVHESGHEWFANSITARDHADLWIHEAFTSYSETLFTERYLDKAAGGKYVRGTRANIQNDSPITGTYGVRSAGSSDMYYKGANMLHTIRQIMDNDEIFRQILRGLNADFYHQTVTAKQVEEYISLKSGIDFSTVFGQYLRTTDIPVLEYQQNGTQFRYRYLHTVKDLRLPLKINGTLIISPTKDWQTVELKSTAPVTLDPDYYVHYSKI